MQPLLVKIYFLIMLECRLSYEDASKIFKVDPQTLEAAIMESSIPITHEYALKFLLYEGTLSATESKRGKFKAEIYLRRLNKILKLESREEKIAALNNLIMDLSGPDISFARQKTGNYTSDEKGLILKYRVKYAVSIRQINAEFGVSTKCVTNWTNDLPEGDLKRQLELLSKYWENGHPRMRTRRNKKEYSRCPKKQ